MLLPPSHLAWRGMCGILVSSPNEIRDWMTYLKYILISDVTQGPSRKIFSQVKKKTTKQNIHQSTVTMHCLLRIFILYILGSEPHLHGDPQGKD